VQRKRRVLLTIRITNDQTNPVLQFELSAILIMYSDARWQSFYASIIDKPAGTKQLSS
jgi:hypothetical protein